jgi:hypothetical protein
MPVSQLTQAFGGFKIASNFTLLKSPKLTRLQQIELNLQQ